MSSQKRRQVKKVSSFIKDKDLATYGARLEQNSALDRIAEGIALLVSKQDTSGTERSADGALVLADGFWETPEAKKILEEVTPKKFIDYFTESDIKKILIKATPVKGKDYKDGEKGEKGAKGDSGPKGLPGRDGEDGKDGKDGSPDTPQDIAEKVNTLESAIEFKVLKNVPKSFGTKFSSTRGKGGGADVTAASTFGTDNRLIRSDGTGKGVQSSTATLTDAGALSGLTDITSTGQLLSADGSVTAPAYSFSGDPDTGWYRVGSTLRYAKDGIERIRITSDGKISVNANATGIATNNGVFHGTYDADTNDQDGIITIDTYSDEGWTTTIGGRRARGTAASPSQLLAGDKLIEFIGKGWDGHGDFCPSNRALMGFYTNEDWNDATHNGTYITLNTTKDATGANHQSVLIDDEGNVAINNATTNITTTVFPAEWAATQSKHLVVVTGGAARDGGIFIRNGDSTAGYDAWMDVSTRTIYHDSLQDHASSTHTFRLRTLGTDVIPAIMDVNGVLIGVGNNLRLQGATSGTATIVAPAAAGTPTLTLPTTTGTLALRQDKLSAFAATTSAELITVISDETGTGSLVFANTPTLVTPLLGTPTSGVLTNCTGLPVSSGISGLGAGIATFLATPSSANLATAVTDETGTGSLVLANTPSLTAVKLAAGTATANTQPIEMTAGTLLTAAEAGSVEYDGKVVYTTPVASARGVSPSIMGSYLSSDFTLANASGVQSAFPTGQDVWTLEASTSYRFKGKYFFSTGTTSHSTALAFDLAGGASITSMKYTALGQKGTANNNATAQSTVFIDRVASTLVIPASAASDAFIEFEGIIRMNAAGTVTPQIAFSANPTGTCLMLTNSFIEFYPIGTNTVTNIGNVA